MKRLITLFSIFIINCYAEDQFPLEHYTFGSTKKSFVYSHLYQTRLSLKCRVQTEKYKCLAFDALKNSNLDKSEVVQERGADSGSRICLKLGGRILLGLDKNNNQNAFCLFKDKSMVSTHGLFDHAYKKLNNL